CLFCSSAGAGGYKRQVYGADVRMTGMLHGKILRSPHAHARIKRIDTSKAEALPGVKAVMTGHDLPEPEDRMAAAGEVAVNLKYLAGNVMTRDKVLYKGHAVAAVAATNIHIAEEAMNLIEVEYELLPPVMDVLDAMKDDAPLLHDDLKMMEFGQQTDKNCNIANHFQFKLGDPEAGFQEADVVIEREFNTQTVHQGYIEPHNATVLWYEDGHLDVWTSTQGQFVVQKQTSEVLGIPVSDVTVTPCEIGGGFGGKIPVYLEPVGAILSKKSGKPVKLIMSRIEEFDATGPTPGSNMTIKIGAKSDGQVVAAEAVLKFEAGAYPGSPVTAGAMCIFAPYAF
ncbi:oxidoreductase, partial [Candidatus Entotheonella serta]